MQRFVIVVTAADGATSVYGTTTDEYHATLLANEVEKDDILADVRLVLPLSDLSQ